MRRQVFLTMNTRRRMAVAEMIMMHHTDAGSGKHIIASSFRLPELRISIAKIMIDCDYCKDGQNVQLAIFKLIEQSMAVRKMTDCGA